MKGDVNLVPAIRAVEKELEEAEGRAKAVYEATVKPYRDSLEQLRTMNTVCEECGGSGKVLRKRACAEDDAPNPDDPTDWLTCDRCKGTGKKPKGRT